MVMSSEIVIMERKMQGYLTIGEFASLRNVDRKSLRYYERIGALIPSYIDKNTKYRYYKIEQLVDLDTILMCLKLGIPLKKIGKYKKNDGTLNIYQLFDDGKQKANEMQAQLYLTMKRLEISIRSIEANEPYKNILTPYKRHIKERYVLRMPFQKTEDELNFKKQANELFIKATKEGLFPVFNFPVGIMAERTMNNIAIYIILEVLDCKINHKELIKLPEGDYLCIQDYNADIYHPTKYCSNIFAENPQAQFAVITNMTLDQYEKGIFPMEKQILM